MLLTFWTPGHHPMRKTVEDLLLRETMMAEPVFQSIFPWRTDDSGRWKGSLSEEVVDKLEIGKEFNPRLNQTESWIAAHDGNSIVVTSGTGSGKTECFMYPVLDTICRHRQEGGIQAIFLYPLNALMEDQRNRLDRLCKKLDLYYAVYNGSTPESNSGRIEEDDADGSAREIRNRIDIRVQRPHILLTNPSMLEYILVRDKDQDMLRNSQGKLRWIVIDEAHTFSGSSALELKWQLKRTLDAFGVTADQVQFACTSATIGDKNAEAQLRRFISNLTGQPESRIKIIGGERVVPPLSEADVNTALQNAGVSLDVKKVMQFRKAINDTDGMSLSEIMHMLTGKNLCSRIDALELIDELCDIEVVGKPLLALRCHFHMRTINGIYACGNPDCHDANHPRFGHVTSHKTQKCSCGANMLELRQCVRCKTFYLTGSEDMHTHELTGYSGNGEETDYFALSEEENLQNDEIVDLTPTDNGLRYLAPAEEVYECPSSEGGELKFGLGFTDEGTYVTDGRTAPNRQWVALMRDGKRYCTECGDNLNTRRGGLYRFQSTINLLNANLAPVFLNECSPDGLNWGKYLAFTDSRQGTAKSAKGFNIEVERNITRKHAYDSLKERHDNPQMDQATMGGITAIQNLPAGAVDEATRQSMMNVLLVNAKFNRSLTLKELSDAIFEQPLYDHIKSDTSDEDAYRKAILRQFLRGRAVSGQNAETLGVMTVEYTSLSNIKAPNELAGVCNDGEWQDFLKIILDYLCRSSNHMHPLDPGEKDFLREVSYPTPISAPSDPKPGISHWPRVSGDGLRQSRYVRLLCAALGVHTLDALKSNEKKINDILYRAFTDLVNAKLLKEVTKAQIGYNLYGNDEFVGTYYLDLGKDIDNVKVKSCTNAWVCPVTQTFVDTIFKGYSPTMGKGDISKEAMSRYRIANPSVTYDCSTLSQQTLGPLWSNFHDNITDTHARAYLAAEHSGQQDRQVLKDYTKEFTAAPPKLNVLQCSTTMEMGVDIGDIDFVLLTTVPPAPSNYMQRVGRAGRSGQTRAVAFSFCNDTPTGVAAFGNPMWAIKSVSQISQAVGSVTILQRHVNAFFFREYLIRGNGLALASTIGDFMDENVDAFIAWLQDMVTDVKMQDKFRSVFGSEPYTADRTSQLMLDVKAEYEQTKDELEKALKAHANDQRRKLAILIQLEKQEDENLLQYLSNAQFLPNASMPTGVMDFRLNDEGHAKQISKIRDEKKQLKERLKKTKSEAARIRIKEQLRDNARRQRKVVSSEVITREGRLGLSEYAPGQTVVVDERNYPSAGILMRGEYGADSREKFLYFCRNCGKIEYLETMDEHLVCPDCGNPYCGILDNRSQSLTLVYEPVGFSADVNEGVSREEMNRRQFYDIRPILLNYGQMGDGAFMTSVSPSREYCSEILFCNAGVGKGFAICTRCGRSVIESQMGGALPDSLSRHKPLDSRYACDASIGNIKRNVVFTARHQTCYVVVAFKNPDGHGYVNDEETALSLGVILKRALAKALGIDPTEVDFGVREEKNRWLVFIYDTAKGGCGYSLYLKDRNVFQKVLDKALHMLREESLCTCEKTGGACPDCLSSRDTFMFDSKLSKRKALEWREAQSRSQTPVPPDVLDESPQARFSLLPISSVLAKAVENPETTRLTLVMSDAPSEPCFSEALDGRTPLGHAVLKARERNLPIRMLVEFHPEFYKSQLDLMPLQNLGNLIPGGEVKLVEDLGDLKPLALVETKSMRQRFFTQSSDPLEAGKDWGDPKYPVYVDDREIAYQAAELPEIEPEPTDIMLEGQTDSAGASTESYFGSVIAPAVGLNADAQKAIKDALNGKGVKVSVSDPYLISPLSMVMAVDLVAELCSRFGCRALGIDVHNTGNANRLGKFALNDYSEICLNFSDQKAANEYMAGICGERLGVVPQFPEDATAHYRYLRMETSDGTSLEIRPDHGFAGGWTSRTKMANVTAESPVRFYRPERQQSDMLYYLLFQRE